MFFLVFKQCSECQQDVLIFGACADEKIVNTESIGLTFENPSKFVTRAQIFTSVNFTENIEFTD